jgi:hypothetical protein
MKLSNLRGETCSMSTCHLFEISGVKIVDRHLHRMRLGVSIIRENKG